MNSAPPKVAFTIDEASKAVGVSRRTIYNLAGQGKLDLRKVGGRTLVTATSLERLIDEAERA